MSAWDTNVLVRHLTEDNAAQLKIARHELDKSERRGEPIWLSLIVLIETAWVLPAYGLSKREVLEVLQTVIDDTRFCIEGGNLFHTALQRSRKKGDLPEHVTALAAKAAGAGKTQTFDKAVAQFAEFEFLPTGSSATRP